MLLEKQFIFHIKRLYDYTLIKEQDSVYLVQSSLSQPNFEKGHNISKCRTLCAIS